MLWKNKYIKHMCPQIDIQVYVKIQYTTKQTGLQHNENKDSFKTQRPCFSTSLREKIKEIKLFILLTHVIPNVNLEKLNLKVK